MPKMNVSRSIDIKATKSEIFKHLNDFNNWVAWSPWLLMEPEAKVTVADDSKSYEWEGDRVGSGNMKVLEEEGDGYINYELNFLKPWKSSATTNFRLEESGDTTKVTWTMNSSLPFFLFWMKKMMQAFVGADYERGLDMLKSLVEKGEIHSKLDFKGNSQFDGCKWVGIKTACSIDETPEKMPQDFGKLWEYCEKDGENIAGEALTIYHKWDLVKNSVSYTAAVQVKEIPGDVPSGFTSGTIDSTDIYTLRHTGAYEHLGNAWSTLYNMHRNKEFKVKKGVHPFETYLNDPKVTDPKDLITEIHFPIK